MVWSWDGQQEDRELPADLQLCYGRSLKALHSESSLPKDFWLRFGYWDTPRLRPILQFCRKWDVNYIITPVCSSWGTVDYCNWLYLQGICSCPQMAELTALAKTQRLPTPGLKRHDAATMLELSRSRLGQSLDGGRPPERTHCRPPWIPQWKWGETREISINIIK